MELMPIFETPNGKVLFIHIPKTGGSTISSELRLHHQVSMYTNSAWPGYLCTPQHLHGGPLRELFQPETLAYVFTVVRHPVDRIRSEYNWNQRKRSIKVPFWLWLRTKLFEVRNSPYLDDNHLRPQEDFLCHNTEVFRLEDGLDKVFQRLSEVTGADYAENPEARKVTDVLSQSVSKADRNLIGKFYANDFRRFGYEV
jgi:hypothetical protein